MTRQEKLDEIMCYKNDAETAKTRLLSIQDGLREIGAIREANTLGTIIAKLEAWQNK